MSKPDIIIKDLQEQACLPIDMSIPTEQNIAAKEFDMPRMYKDLENGVGRMWNFKTTTVPVIVGALARTKRGCQKHLDKIPGQPQLQKNLTNSIDKCSSYFYARHSLFRFQLCFDWCFGFLDLHEPKINGVTRNR